MKKGENVRKVTKEYILNLFKKAKKIKNQKLKLEMYKKIRILSQNIGKHIIKPIDPD